MSAPSRGTSRHSSTTVLDAEPPPLSGFSIVRNASILDYPVEAALRSALPVCDEIIVNVGISRDDTLERVAALGEPALQYFHTDWGPERGRRITHSEETNRAMDRCRHDWALYIQADEVLHDADYPALRSALARAASDPRVEGLLFDYLHFYGSPEWILWGRCSYRCEARVIRRGTGIRSLGGGQGFRVNGRKPRVIHSGARVFHYGYVKKSCCALTEKHRLFARYGGRDDSKVEPFTYRRNPALTRYEGSHPAAARPWLESSAWTFRPEQLAPPRFSGELVGDRISDAVERLTGHRFFEHRNYELIE